MRLPAPVIITGRRCLIVASKEPKNDFDWNRPYVDLAAMEHYEALDRKTAALFGRLVKAVMLANVEYKIRHGELHTTRRMKPPPGCGRIFPGYLVVRKLGTAEQYETWMPAHVFEELYSPACSRSVAAEDQA